MSIASLTQISGFTDSRQTVRYFTQGQCHALAWELHRLTKWSLGILSDDLVGTPDYSGHAFVINPEGMAVDIRGIQPIDVFRKDWDYLPHFYIFRSPAEYKKEMKLWEGERPYNKDPYAKFWAQSIVDILRT